MDLSLELSKQRIVKLYLEELHKGGIRAEDFSNKLDVILQSVYDDGREMGLTEALNYVENNQDRERLFNAIDELRKELDNVEGENV